MREIRCASHDDEDVKEKEYLKLKNKERESD